MIRKSFHESSVNRAQFYFALTLAGLLSLLILSASPPVLSAGGGSGSFSPHPTTPTFGEGKGWDVKLGDLDNDADLDAVVANNGIGDACDEQTGPPLNKDQCKNAGWLKFDVPRRFKNQGDCIQYVNTGN